MSSSDTGRFLCVSIHDVSPHTRPECERLLEAVHAAAPIPVTLLVVPAYHHRAVADPAGYDRWLEHRMSQGDELALHGYTHLDEGAPPACWWSRYKRQVYTVGEGEFSALGAAEARRRLRWGLDWFACRDWPVPGFVAPAWLLSEEAFQVLREFPFEYTTTFNRFHFLPQQRSMRAPTLVYSSRNAWGRALSRQANSLWSAALRTSPVVRFGLHPRDAHCPDTVRHLQRTIAALAESRQAITKGAFARQWCARAAAGEWSDWKAPAALQVGKKGA
jgi:predicted deacetylase